jgi:PleD family two-component response regulator
MTNVSDKTSIPSTGIVSTLRELEAKLSLIKGRELSMEGGLLLSDCRTLTAELLQQLGPNISSSKMPAGRQTIDPVKLLVIDDDEDLQRVLQYVMPASWPIDVSSVIDPRAALNAVRSIKPDIIMIDVLLPEISGFSLMSSLKQVPECRDTKFIMGSARSYERDRITSLQMGADDFLAKPYNAEELALRILHLAAA